MLLDASIATTASADSDPTSHQPRCGWDDVIFIHSSIPITEQDKRAPCQAPFAGPSSLDQHSQLYGKHAKP